MSNVLSFKGMALFAALVGWIFLQAQVQARKTFKPRLGRLIKGFLPGPPKVP